ncbi:hypothetical protein AB9F35_21875 [Rhizobium leguminosarum]|uniref:hypothetical protein n=1 Tax=Rhizobium leguminosarum TaxID=384 RepID=UPI003F9871A1
MLVDYLRYLAFNGRLRQFFEEDIYQYVKPGISTGQHLRFSPKYIDESVGLRGQQVIHEIYWNGHSRDLHLEQLKREMGIEGPYDDLTSDRFKLDGRPATSTYHDGKYQSPQVEIIIDIDPRHWNADYQERRSYGDTPILFRSAGPAVGQLSSGDRVKDSARPDTSYGTICGFFSSEGSSSFALTCGHVIAAEAMAAVKRQRKIWKIPLPTAYQSIGQVRHFTMCGPPTTVGALTTHLDAALVEMPRSPLASLRWRARHVAIPRPIAAILQEEPVKFRGSGRLFDREARISSITVRKSMDILRDGVLRDMGDLLMLGHRFKPYFAGSVSRPGDSGSAVRQDFSDVGSFKDLNHWHGMILGADENNTYASYSEHLCAWAGQQIGDVNLEFLFDA